MSKNAFVLTKQHVFLYKLQKKKRFRLRFPKAMHILLLFTSLGQLRQHRSYFVHFQSKTKDILSFWLFLIFFSKLRCNLRIRHCFPGIKFEDDFSDLFLLLYFLATCVILEDTLLTGVFINTDDVGPSVANSVPECELKCLETVNCVRFTFYSNFCILWESFAQQIFQTGAITGKFYLKQCFNINKRLQFLILPKMYSFENEKVFCGGLFFFQKHQKKQRKRCFR